MSEFVMNLKNALLASTVLGTLGILGMLHLYETSTNYTQQELTRQMAPTTAYATTIPADTRLEVASVRY